MRAIACGLITVGLSLPLASGAEAAFSGRIGGFRPPPFVHHGHFRDRRFERNERRDADRGEGHGHFWNSPVLFEDRILSVTPDAAPPAAAGELVIYAPAFVPPAKRAAASGPRIIYIGAQPATRLPVVIYGTRLAVAN